jgi:hypothetical protein
MKTIFLQIVSLAIVVTLASCDREGRIKERPDNIVPTGERAEAYQQIMADFPEHKNVKLTKANLFDAAAGKEIVLKNESDVYVTYISEGASYSNTVGWYSYMPNAKPGHPSEVELHVLFPHVSDRVLKQGDRLRLGDQKFPAGTVVGFFLIIQGWDNGSINYDKETFYTDIDWNPNQQQQHILYRQSTIGDLVLTFEDELTSVDSDQDFNDLIFIISDNPNEAQITNFDLSKVVEY